MRITLSELQTRPGLLELFERYGAYNVRVFGSVARGEDRDGSDIDFLVKYRRGTTLLDVVALIDELSEYLGREVDVVSEDALHPYFRDRVLEEATAIEP